MRPSATSHGDRAFTSGVAALMALVVTVAPGAQQRDRPTAPSPAPADGTISVSGTVTSAGSGDDVVRSAVVSLIPVAGGDGIATVTDHEGRFTITDAAEGRYTLVAQKAAYLTNAYGAKRPGRPGVTLVLTKDRIVEDLHVVLPKGGVIAGRVLHAMGGGQRDIQVVAVPTSRATAGGAFDTRARAFYSDDQGDYRIWGLPPDDYLVMILPTTTAGVFPMETRAPGEIDALLRHLAGPRSAQTPAPVTTAPPRRGYAPAYYPGTPVAALATPVRVGLGEVKQGIDIPFDAYPLASVSGIVRGIGGEVTQAVSLSVETIGPPLPTFNALTFPNRRPDAQGRFALANVPPGTYRITARGGGVTFRDGGIETNDANQIHWATTTVAVNGDDIDSLVLSLQPGLTFSGRIDTSTTTQTVSLKGATLSLTPRGAGAPPARTAVIGEDGSFTVTGLHPATWELALTLPAALANAWGVQSVTAGGRELRDQPLTLEGGSIGDAVVTLSDRRSEVTGTLSTAGGAPATDYFIVLFPIDRGLWHDTSPRIRVVRPNIDGTFSARDLPAGDYRIAAVTDVEDDEWRQASFLESLLEVSLAVVVRAGATTTQDLRIR